MELHDTFMNTYHRLAPIFAEGKGAKLTDVQGKTYIDFTAGIAVNSLGHGHPVLTEAIASQAAKLIHVSNYFRSDVALAFAAALTEACGMVNVFLGNSGAEANEGAIKVARKYSLKKYGPGRHKIVTLQGSFHGRTITTLSATGQDRFHQDFGPFTEGFMHVPSGDLPALDAALDSSVCGFMFEPVQGESGIRLQDSAYIQAAVKLCQERDILVMADEVQSGVGRTGTFLACQQLGVVPDVVTLAKGLAGGVPVGAVLAGEKAKDALGSGDHGSTFGGNPLTCAAGMAVLSVVNNEAFLADITRKGKLMVDEIVAWKSPHVKEIRGLGLMLGVDIDVPAWPILEKAVDSGLLALSAGPQTLRFLPPYIISDEEIKEGLAILKKVLDENA